MAEFNGTPHNTAKLGEIAKNLDNVKYPKVVVNSNDEK